MQNPEKLLLEKKDVYQTLNLSEHSFFYADQVNSNPYVLKDQTCSTLYSFVLTQLAEDLKKDSFNESEMNIRLGSFLADSDQEVRTFSEEEKNYLKVLVNSGIVSDFYKAQRVMIGMHFWVFSCVLELLLHHTKGYGQAITDQDIFDATQSLRKIAETHFHPDAFLQRDSSMASKSSENSDEIQYPLIDYTINFSTWPWYKKCWAGLVWFVRRVFVPILTAITVAGMASTFALASVSGTIQVMSVSFFTLAIIFGCCSLVSNTFLGLKSTYVTFLDMIGNPRAFFGRMSQSWQRAGVLMAALASVAVAVFFFFDLNGTTYFALVQMGLAHGAAAVMIACVLATMTGVVSGCLVFADFVKKLDGLAKIRTEWTLTNIVKHFFAALGVEYHEDPLKKIPIRWHLSKMIGWVIGLVSSLYLFFHAPFCQQALVVAMGVSLSQFVLVLAAVGWIVLVGPLCGRGLGQIANGIKGIFTKGQVKVWYEKFLSLTRWQKFVIVGTILVFLCILGNNFAWGATAGCIGLIGIVLMTLLVLQSFLLNMGSTLNLVSDAFPAQTVRSCELRPSNEEDQHRDFTITGRFVYSGSGAKNKVQSFPIHFKRGEDNDEGHPVVVAEIRNHSVEASLTK